MIETRANDNSHIMFMQCFTTISRGFPDILKSKNLCLLNLHSVHATRLLDRSLVIILSPPKGGMKDLYNSKGFSFIPEQVQYFYFLEAKFIIFFRMR